MPADPKVNVGVAAIVWDDRNDSLVVITRAGKDAEEPGAISVPGGWIDHGETPVEAAIREVKEETGITAEVMVDDIFDGPILGCTQHIHHKNGNSVICIWVLLGPTSDAPSEFTEIPEPEKVSKIEWMAAKDLESVDPTLMFTPLRLALEQGIW